MTGWSVSELYIEIAVIEKTYKCKLCETNVLKDSKISLWHMFSYI